MLDNFLIAEEETSDSSTWASYVSHEEVLRKIEKEGYILRIRKFVELLVSKNI